MTTAGLKKYSMESDFVKELDRGIMEFIEKGMDNDDEEQFNELALREFELQYHTVEPYRKFCNKKGITPETAERWEQIPAVPSMAFKNFVIASFPIEKAEHAYFTSGTTDPRRKGKIFRDPEAVKLINAANGLLTRRYIFPDIKRMKILLMTPSPSMVPSTGMAIGLERVRQEFGTSESAYLITHFGLDVEFLLKSLMEAEETGKPLALIGSTSGFIYFLKACEAEGLSFSLPPGSRVCDGGGYLGQFGECSRDEYFEKCRRILGVTESYCINVLGMGEISTNFFDNVLHSLLQGKALNRYKVIPPWTKTQVVNINTLEPVPAGEVGLLKHYDLVNRSMVLAVQTDNLGYEVKDGIEIVGRWKKKAGTLEAEEIRGSHGGNIITQLVDMLLRRNLKKIGGVYRKILKKR